jgi:NDP-4-keto-2,6-dideoxyhexose 3-C-methyltransferase
MIRHIEACRICGNKNLISILNLGEQVLTGVFPRSVNERITRGPLELVKCAENGPDGCGLVQLRHSYEPGEMYAHNYGYRSGLNRSMVRHLHDRVAKILKINKLTAGDVVIDIGSNDSTLLQGYPKDLKLLGVDPSGVKFKNYYPAHIGLVADFFSAAKVKERLGGGVKAQVVTAIAMFYDLESPVEFMRQVHEILDDDGVWVLEQSYMPAMLEHDSYDTICHEHVEYYAFKQIKWIADAAGFKVIDVEFNDSNGGSFAVTMAKKTSPRHKENTALVEQILADEKRKGFSTLKPFEAFKGRIFAQREELIEFVKKVKAKEQKIFGYGASTKGNVILQLCGFTPSDIPYIAEVNEDKFGCFTPGTNIPIISEAQAKAMNPDYFLVLPWHFKDNIIERETGYLNGGGSLVFPLPKIEIVSKEAKAV